jgi:hypothetical protein
MRDFRSREGELQVERLLPRQARMLASRQQFKWLVRIIYMLVAATGVAPKGGSQCGC